MDLIKHGWQTNKGFVIDLRWNRRWCFRIENFYDDESKKCCRFDERLEYIFYIGKLWSKHWFLVFETMVLWHFVLKYERSGIVGDQSYINGERNNGLSFFVWGYMEPAEEIVSSWWECSLLMDITTNRTWSGQQERWSESESRSPGCTMCELRAAGWCYISPTSTYTWNITYTGGSQGSDDL